MKTKIKRFLTLKSIFTVGFLGLILSSSASAWTIQSLNLGGVFVNGAYDPFDGENDSIFGSYIRDTGATFIGGSKSLLSDYVPGSANAIIVNLPVQGYSLTKTESDILTDLLNSNTRVLIFGEHSSWVSIDKDIADVVRGSYQGSGSSSQTINSNIFPLITEGVNDVTFSGPGKISPKGENGLSLTSDDAITLWGANDNFLVFMDVNALSNDHIGEADNDRLARNIANFLAGGGSTIPEPSAYAGLLGAFTLGFTLLRRRK